MKNIFSLLILMVFISPAFAQDGDFHLDKQFRINKTGVIDLSSSDAKVFISGSARTTTHVKIDRKIVAKGWSSGNRNFTVDVLEQDGNLHIREKKDGATVSVGYYHEEYKIEIEAPEWISLTIRGDDGDYYIKNINGSISLSLDDADAELVSCKGNQFVFRFDDGDLRMDKGRGSLEIQADDADVEIYNATFNSIDAEVDDGDLIIETSLNDTGKYKLEAQDGLISMNITGGGGQFNIHHDDGSVTTQGDYKILFESEDETSVSLPNGKAIVNLRADDARIKLFSK